MRIDRCWIGLFACAALIGMMLTGCSKEGGSSNAAKSGNAGTTTQTTAGRKKIVFVFKKGGISYSELCKTGAQRANDDKSLNVEVEYEASAEGTAEKQADIINQAIVGKADAIVVSPVDSKAIVAPIDNAVRAGIKVFTWDSDAPDSKRTFYVAAIDDLLIGANIMDGVAKSVGEKGKVLVFSGQRTAENLNRHVEGIENESKKYPGITLATPYVYNDDDNGKAGQMAQTALASKDPDAVGIACTNSVSPRAAAETLRHLNRVGKVMVWGLGMPMENKDYVKDGSITGLYLWDPRELTYQTAKLVAAALNGKMPQQGDQIPGKGDITVKGPIITLPLRITITKENVDTFDF
jgi:ABC-type sugar transport system substrate-binding protein